MPTEKVNWGGLTSLVVHNLPAGTQPKVVVVLCHGYGAPATDLVGLAEPILATAREGFRAALVFPGAPMELTEMGMPGGRAWWPVDLDRLINRRTPELLEKFRTTCPPGLAESRDRIVALLAEAGRHFGVGVDRFILGGFSQGAMLTTDVALRLKKPPAGLCILSGALIDAPEWEKLARERGPLKVLQSHGRYDSILPFSLASGLRDLLRESGAGLDFYEFDGDHEIPLEVLHRLTHFIRDSGSEG